MTEHIRLLLSLLAPAAAAAQQVPIGPLKPSDAVLKDTIGQTFAVRELHDGRVVVPSGTRALVANPSLLVVNLKTGTAEPIPGAPLGMPIRLAGDTTLFASHQTGWIFLDGTKVLGMLPPTNPVVAAVPQMFGADASGYVLTATGGRPKSDSQEVVRVARATGVQETVARMWQGPFPPPGTPYPPYRVQEAAVLALDGWIAIVRTAPYRVDWRTPSGEWIRGAPIAVPVVKMDDREKTAYMLRQSIAMRGPPQPIGSVPDWPSEVPPVRCCAPPLMSLDGKVLVTRTPTADYPGTRYDVINRRGELEREIVMGENEMIVGFGATDIYITTRVSNGSYVLSRHPWP